MLSIGINFYKATENQQTVIILLLIASSYFALQLKSTIVEQFRTSKLAICILRK